MKSSGVLVSAGADLTAERSFQRPLGTYIKLCLGLTDVSASKRLVRGHVTLVVTC